MGLIVLCLAVIFSLSWHNDADGSGEASLVVNGVLRAIHIDVDCVDGALQMGSQVDAREKHCRHNNLWLCFGDLCPMCSGTLSWLFVGFF